MILAERHARVMAEAHAAVVKAEAANAQADLSRSEALNAHLKLEIEKPEALWAADAGRLLEQEFLKYLETAATEDELAGQVQRRRHSFQRKRPSRKQRAHRHRESCGAVVRGYETEVIALALWPSKWHRRIGTGVGRRRRNWSVRSVGRDRVASPPPHRLRLGGHRLSQPSGA